MRFILFIFLPGILFCQWIQLRTPVTESDFRDLIVHKNYIYASNTDGISRSSDSGESWEDVSDGLRNWDYKVLLSTGDSLYTGFAYGGLYLFNETFRKWVLLNDTVKVNALAAKNGFFYSGTTLTGLYSSTDYGRTWKQAGFNNEAIISIKILNGKIIISTYKNLFCSENDGGSWQQISDNSLTGNITCFEIHDSSIILGTFTGLFKSNDLGKTWIQFDPLIRSLFSVSASGTRILAGTYYGPYYSSNGGVDWVKVNTGLGDSIIVSSLIYESDILGASFYNGLYKLNSNTFSWKNIFRGLKPANIFSIAAGNNNIFISTGPNISGVYKSTDDGSNWTKLNTPMDVYFAGLSYHKDELYLKSDLVYVSRDNGANWDTLIHTNEFTGMHFYHDSLFLPGVSGIYVYSLETGKMEKIYEGFVNVITVKENLIFAGLYMDGVYISRDRGKTWEAANEGLIYSVFMSDMGITALTVYGDKVFCSTDYGFFYSDLDSIHWKKINNIILQSLFTIGDKIIGSFSGGIIYSVDSGETWNFDYLPAKNLLSIAHDSTNIFAGTSTGVWKKEISQLTDIKELPKSLPKFIILNQNYPNPFNPETTIRYELPTASSVNLKVYDVLGNEVAILIRGEQPGGLHEVTWNGSPFPSGIYIYQLTSGQFRACRKMLLIK